MNDSICYAIDLHRSTILGIPVNSPLVGSFLGVFLAMLLGILADYIKKCRNRFKHRQMLYNEIKKGIEVINENKKLLEECKSVGEPFPLEKLPSIIPTNSWDSSIYSGALKLFPIEETVELTRLYNLIKSYNNEINRYLDIKLDRVASYDSKAIGPSTNACRRYEEDILPKYCEDLLPKIKKFNEIQAPKATKQFWQFWLWKIS